MGLAEMEGTKELWVTAKKKDGTEMAWIKECNDIARLDKEEHEVAQAIYTKLNAWIAEDVANKERLKNFKEGFEMVHTDGNKYRIIQYDDGHLKISRWRATSGGGKGGFQKSNYIHMRIEAIKMAKFEEAYDTINNQTENDNWSITVLDRPDDKGGPMFVMTNGKPYTPKVDGASASASSGGSSNEEGNKEESQQEG